MQHTQEKKIITVFGATGKQGGAILCSLLKDGNFHLRGVCRERDEEVTTHLREKGVEMVKANIGTGEGLENALKGAWATFVVTQSFDSDIENKEFECGKRLVDKAKQAGVKVLVWSTLPHAHKISGGKYCVPHFTEKAKVEDYIRNLQKGKEGFDTVTFIAPAFYYQNFKLKAFCPKKEGDMYKFEFPKTNTLTACDIMDIGPLFLRILKDPHAFNLKTIIMDGEHSSPKHFVHKFQEVTGKKACLKEYDRAELEKCPDVHHGKQLASMFGFIDEFNYFGKEKDIVGLVHGREVLPELKNWETYLRESGWKGETQTP